MTDKSAHVNKYLMKETTVPCFVYPITSFNRRTRKQCITKQAKLYLLQNPNAMNGDNPYIKNLGLTEWS
jgi:hypothetical protein